MTKKIAKSKKESEKSKRTKIVTSVVAPECRGGGVDSLLGKTLVLHEKGVSARRKEEMLVKYPHPPFYDLVIPHKNDTYEVFIVIKVMK